MNTEDQRNRKRGTRITLYIVGGIALILYALMYFLVISRG